MATLFQIISQQGRLTNVGPNNSIDARKWFREKAGQVRNVDVRNLYRQSQPFLTNRPAVGRMYLFFYDPKTKDTLPYYDRFPLVFPFRRVQDGFYGINLHYLPPLLRARLMDALYSTTNNDKMDESTRLRINYNILSSAAKFKYFKPCVKHYLNNHVKSRFLYIDPNQWDIALFLPLERFGRTSRQTVYKDSKLKINNG